MELDIVCMFVCLIIYGMNFCRDKGENLVMLDNWILGEVIVGLILILVVNFNF